MRSLLLATSWYLALSSLAVAAENAVAIVGATIIDVENAGRSTCRAGDLLVVQPL